MPTCWPTIAVPCTQYSVPVAVHVSQSHRQQRERLAACRASPHASRLASQGMVAHQPIIVSSRHPHSLVKDCTALSTSPVFLCFCLYVKGCGVAGIGWRATLLPCARADYGVLMSCTKVEQRSPLEVDHPFPPHFHVVWRQRGYVLHTLCIIIIIIIIVVHACGGGGLARPAVWDMSVEV